MRSHRLFVLHIQEGTEAGTDAWQHNPVAQVSSNFGNPRVGQPDQWVDTDDRAWAQADYNDVAISVENEGNTGDRLNDNQIENAAQLLAWAHITHGTKMQVTDDPNGEGVIGHGQLGVAGGDHPDCPGTPILEQRQQIVDRAIQITNGDDMAISDADAAKIANLTSSLVRNTGLGRQTVDGHLLGAGIETSIGVEAAKGEARHEETISTIKSITGAEVDEVKLVVAMTANQDFMNKLAAAFAAHFKVS